jgi:hypothetical protein
MELTGKIKVINETQTFESGFSKREFVVTTSEQYPQDIKLEFVKDKCGLLDKYKEGQDVTVGFNLRGNEYNDKYYVNLQAWKIGHNDGTEYTIAEVQEKKKPQPIQEIEGDSLPF